MRQLFFVILLIFSTSALHAQSLEQFKQQLRLPDSIYRSRVEVNEQGSAASAVRAAAQANPMEKVRGYRVCIFVDNGQQARNGAFAAMARFREIFPDVPAYWVYDNPDFKVSVGNCFTLEEAIVLKGKIQGAFDRAFVVRQEIPLKLFGEKVIPAVSAEKNDSAPEIAPTNP